jgi:biopolymer transport protein ExbD
MAKIHRMKPGEEIPQSSLADVAFLLLIFFIATTTISEEFGLSLILPAKSQPGQQQEVNRKNVMVISTDPTGATFFVDNQPTPLREIRDRVKEAEAANDKLVVSVEPSPQAPYRAMVDILDELKIAGASRISLKTKGA